MAYDVKTVIKIAEQEVGYLEKATNKNLDDKTKNAGKNNFTKYWAEIAPGMNGNAWCNCFVNWSFVQAYGEKAAKKLLCTDAGWSFYTPTSSGYFKKKSQWITKNPQPGDIIYFKNSTRIHHVGLVYKVDKTKVYTIEGNTSAGVGVIPNGGGVAKKSYLLSNPAIAGYGRPDYGTMVSPLYPKYTGTSSSIVSALSEVGETNVTKANRKKIAEKNGITDYTGTEEQNLKMLRMLKAGTLKKVD